MKNLLLLTLLALGMAGCAQKTEAPEVKGGQYWQEGVVCQIYPRTF